MRKALSYLLPLLVAFIALIPPIKFRIPAPTEHWPLLIAVAGFLGIRILFIKVNWIVKAIATLSFISCFFSSIPYLSFNTYVAIVAHCYLYIGLTMMDSWRPMFAAVKSLLIFNAILLVMQYLGLDQLYNWSLEAPTCFGVTGQHMQMGSYSVILTTLLGILSPLFIIFPILTALICNSSWTLFCAGAGTITYLLCKPPILRRPAGQLHPRRETKKKIIFVLSICLILAASISMAFLTNKVQANLSENGRLGIWKISLELLKEHPWTGWGPGTFKGVFPSLSKAFFNYNGIPWIHAHNDFVQIAFEFGWPLFCLALFAWGSIFGNLLNNFDRKGSAILIAGFVMITLDMMVHFPTRLAEIAPLVITFLAYCDNWLNKKIK